MMLELSYLSILPLPVLLALVGSILVSVFVFIQSCLDMLTTTGEIPQLYYRGSSLNNHVIAKCRLKDRQFKPCLWLRYKHVQTVLPVILHKPEVTFEREYLQMMDKGVVALDWVMTPHVKVKRKTPILLVVPSMTEGAVAMSSICHQAISRGMKPLVFNRRGFGGSHLTTPRLTSCGDPSDLRQVIIYIKQRLPKSPLAAIAYGSGCGLLLSYLGEFGSSAMLSVTVCISPTFDEPARFSDHFRSPYDFLLLLRLKSVVCHHLPALSPAMDADGVISSWTFDQLNQTAFSPLTSLGNPTTTTTTNTTTNPNSSVVDQFWESNNSMRDVDDIAVPILCVSSLDDPLNPSTDIPYDLFKCYPNFLLVLTDRGGHCGFLEGFPPQTSWSDTLSLDYIESVIEFTTKSNPPLRRPDSAPVLRSRYHSISVTGRGSSNYSSFFQGYRHSSDTSNNRSSRSGSGSGGGGGGSFSGSRVGMKLPGQSGPTDRSGSIKRCDSATTTANRSDVIKVNGGGQSLLRRQSSLTLRPKMQRFTL